MDKNGAADLRYRENELVVLSPVSNNAYDACQRTASNLYPVVHINIRRRFNRDTGINGALDRGDFPRLISKREIFPLL
jgi:hypothetical protein